MSQKARPVGDVAVVRYMFIKIALFCGLFAMAIGLAWLYQPWIMLTHKNLFQIALVVFLIWAVSAGLIERYGGHAWFRWVQLLFDTVVVTTLVWLTDGPKSPFFVLYFMNIVAAAWLLPGWGALSVATIDALVFTVTTLVGLYGFTEWDIATSGVLVYTELTLRVFSLFLVGMLSGTLSGSLQQTRSALAAAVQGVEQLRADHHVVLNQLDSGIVVVSEDGIIRALNPAAVRILGSVNDQALTQVLVPQDDVWEQDFVLGEMHKILVCSRHGLERGGTVVVVEDITNWRKMEERVARDERLAAVGRLAAGLAHEIRNPLASLSGAVQIMEDEAEDELHGIVLREVENLNELVEDFLDIARPLHLRTSPTNINSIVRDVVVAFEQDRRYQGRITISASLSEVPVLDLDANRVRQVVWNLVLNAAQATPEEGQILIRVKPAGDGVQVEVEDEGVGIPPQRMSRIFDPFYTTRSGGTGLGLANVDRIVRAHEGEVVLRSQEGEGTCFTLNFPGNVESATLEPVVGLG